MKTLIFSFTVFLLINISTKAQLKQGTFLLGGGLSAGTTHQEVTIDLNNSKSETDQIGFSFYPNVGYFVIESLVAGINGRISVTGASRLI